VGLFKWHNKENGRLIEGYLALLCSETPVVANEVLGIPIRHVEHWMCSSPVAGTGNPDYAKCGCLIGVTLMALHRLYPDNNVSRYPDIEQDVINALKEVDGDFGGLTDQDIHNVGMAVYHEVFHAVYPPEHFENDEEWREACEERERAMAFKIKNLIRINLGIPQIHKPE
jgi:hypothetical protein